MGVCVMYMRQLNKPKIGSKAGEISYQGHPVSSQIGAFWVV